MTEEINTNTDVDALRTALDQGDFEEGLKFASRLQAASSTELLDDLQTLVTEGRYDDAEVVFGQLITTYETQRPVEGARATATRQAQHQSSVSLSEQRELARSLRTLTATRLKRTQLVSSLSEFFDAREESEQSPSDVTAMISETKSQESTLSDELETAASVTDDVSLPATLRIVQFSFTPAPVEVEGTTTARVVIENVGDERATSVTATLSTFGDASLELLFGEIKPGQTSERTASLSPGDPGVRTSSVTVTHDSGADKRASQTVSIVEDDGGQEVPPIPGNSEPPTDPDGDGLYEDLNGDGRFDIRDVSVFLDHYQSDEVQSNAGLFDFTGDGRVDIRDVAELLQQVF